MDDMNKLMKIPQEFEEYLRGVELTEDEIGFLNWIVKWDHWTVKNLQPVLQKVRGMAAIEMPAILPPNEPLTQADLAKMHFDRVWIDYGINEYGERDCEEGVVLYGKLYSVDSLEGAGFEEMLFDTCDGETLDQPSGDYEVYRRLPE